MEVISLCSLPVAALLWSTEQRGWSLTVICKATFDLVPGELVLSTDQLPIVRADRHWDDDPNASLWAASDLAPFKPKVDVVAVGHAHPPGKHPRSSFETRMVIRSIDKKVVVDDTKERLTDMGPRPASSPPRMNKLGRHAEDWSPERWFEREIPRELDLGYFNVAPPDQQIDKLKTGDVLRLDNLHPKHARLVTKLPAVKPLAYVERSGAEPELLTMRCDTLWIDTDQRSCAVTWRGQLRLSGPREPARCLVLLSESGENIAWDEAEALRESLDVPPWVDRGPDSVGAIDLAETGAHVPAKGRQLHVAVVAGPTVEPAPRSMQGVFLSASEVQSLHDDDLDGPEEMATTMGEDDEGAPWSQRHAIRLTKLLWVAPDQLGAVSSHPAWKSLVAGHPPLRDERENARRIVGAVIHEVEPVDAPGIEAALMQATATHPFEPPLVVSDGTLAPSYGAADRLRATVSTVTPFASGDQALADMLTDARELLSLPWLATADGIAEELVARLFEAFERHERALPPNFVAAQSSRILVQERRYRESELWGTRWVRCDFTPTGARGAIPAYLPVEARASLPLSPRIDVRLIAAVDVQEDAYETHPLCLRVAALARRVDS